MSFPIKNGDFRLSIVMLVYQRVAMKEKMDEQWKFHYENIWIKIRGVKNRS